MRNRGILAIEYSLFLAIVVAAILGMMVYLKRGIMGKMRQSADTFGYGQQYEPGKTTCYDANGNAISCN